MSNRAGGPGRPPPAHTPPAAGPTTGFTLHASGQAGYTQLQAGVPSNPPMPADAPLAGKSIDQLLDRLKAIQERKAELERQEQAILKEARRRVEKQADRLNRLGVTPPPPPAYNTPVSASSFGPPPAPVFNKWAGGLYNSPPPAPNQDLPPGPPPR